MESNSIDRIRSTTFGVSRRGYDKREVERFLNQVADWLETGGGDESRSNTLRRELEKVGERTSAILSAAHEAAEEMRGEAERAAAQIKQTVREESEHKHSEADAYSTETRASADGYAEKARAAADGYSAKTRADSDSYSADTRAGADREADEIENHARTRGREAVEAAKSEGERVVAEGRKRRSDIEAVISDLVSRRDAVLDDVDRLTGELRSAVGGRSEPAPDPVVYDEPPEAPAAPRPARKAAAKPKRPAAGTRSDSGSARAETEGAPAPGSARKKSTKAKSKQVRT